MCSGSIHLTGPADERWSTLHAAQCQSGVPKRNTIARRKTRAQRFAIASRAIQHRDPAPSVRQVRGDEQITYSTTADIRKLVTSCSSTSKPGAPRVGGASPEYLTSGVHRLARGQWRRDGGSAPQLFHVAARSPASPLPTFGALAFKWHDVPKRGREGSRLDDLFLATSSESAV